MTRKGKKAEDKAADSFGDETVSSNAQPGASFAPESNNELTDLPYRKTPEYRRLLEHFQSAEWEACLVSLDRLLADFPDDTHLVDFRHDVQVRSEREHHSARQSASDQQVARRQAVARTVFGGVAVILMVGVGLWLAGAYRQEETRRMLAVQATQTADALTAQEEMAAVFMKVGRAQEALDLYLEIQQTDPLRAGLGEAMAAARQAVAAEQSYQQGLRAMQAGDNARALELLQEVARLEPNYKDTAGLIEEVSKRQQVAALVQAIDEAYDRGDFGAVILNHEAIQALDPYADLSELEEKLFSSYQDVILKIAAKPDPTTEEIEAAARYYRTALALFPQSIAYAREQKELQEVAIELLASQYYLQGINLLENSDYTIEGLQQSMLVLQRAREKAPDSVLADAAIEKAEKFIDAYDALVRSDWDKAISVFEDLYKRDSEFAGGRVRSFLYDAHVARGDLLMLNADFAGALADFQAAEQHAWAQQENVLRLFQIEIRVAGALRKLGRLDQAVEFYQFSFKQMSAAANLSKPENSDLRETIAQAELAVSQGNAVGALDLYEQAVEESDPLYDLKEINARRGDTLPNIAFERGSTLVSLISANDLGGSLVLSRTRPLFVPTLAASVQP